MTRKRERREFTAVDIARQERDSPRKAAAYFARESRTFGA